MQVALEIKEYLNYKVSNIKELDTNNNFNITEKLSNKKQTTIVSNKSLMADIEGIHVGPTRNYTWYTSKALISSQESWTNPYNAPLILFHNEKDGKIIGRVLNAEYTSKNTRSGTPALTFTCNIADKEAIESVEDGRLQTVSIGVIAKDVSCSICNAQLAAGEECDHERGVKYGDKTCYWVINEMEAKELSYVIVPSDPFAHNVSIYKPKSFTQSEIAENSDSIDNLKGDISMSNLKNEIIESKEEKIAENIEEVVKETISLEEYESIKTENTSLKEQVKKLENELQSEKSIRENSENQLLELNKQLKELFIDKVLTLREKLNRPSLAKNLFESRSMDSLSDSIVELSEEINLLEANNINIIEEKIEDNSKDIKEEADNKGSLDTITNVKNDAMINENADKTSNKLEKNEKKPGLDVKEEEVDSNILKEEELNSVVNFYNL